FASHERRTGHRQVTAGRDGRRETLDRPGLDLADPFRGYTAQRAEARDPRGEAPGERPREDLARRRRRLEPSRDVDALAGDEELVALGRARRDLAGVHPHPKLDALHRSYVREREGDEHRVGRAERAFRIVLMRGRDPEDGHPGVADDLLDRGAVLLE